MRKGSSIIGLKVISQAVREEDRASLGTVRDLVFDHETDEVLALVMSEKELFGLIDAQVVPWSQIVGIGSDAIIVQSLDSKIPAGSDPRVKAVMDRQTVLSGTKLYTTDGRALGTFADLCIDEATGRVEGYEISGGFVSDTMSGKRFIPAPGEMTLTRDVALVPPAVAAAVEAQRVEEPGGVQGATAAVGARVGDAYANLADASIEKQKEFVIGRVAAHDVILPPDAAVAPVATAPAAMAAGAMEEEVTTPPVENATPPTATWAAGPAADGTEAVPGAIVSGNILVRQGEVITREHADRAAAAGVLHQLVLAAGGYAEEPAAGQRDGLTTVKENAAHLWDTIKQKATELSTVAQERRAEMQAQAEENHVKSALGRPTTRVILDRSDNVILNAGDLITNAAVQQARAAGVLDILLDSVYMADPHITPDMQRTQSHGEAAIPTQADAHAGAAANGSGPGGVAASMPPAQPAAEPMERAAEPTVVEETTAELATVEPEAEHRELALATAAPDTAHTAE